MFVAAGGFDGLPCSAENIDYIATLTCSTPCDVPACGASLSGGCCTPHPTPYCDDQDCCEAVCELDPFCCQSAWDGFCVDDDDNLYVTANSDRIRAIVVFDPAARPIGRIAFPASPSNCTFGGPDRRTLYVTTLHAIYEVAMGRQGLP